MKILLPDGWTSPKGYSQGVVAEGYLSVKNIFIAEKIFAKHDENYMPAEVANAIQDSGYWKNQYGAN